MQDKISGKPFEELQRRVRIRVDELGIKPATLARMFGLGKDYIRDIISDDNRKTALSLKKLPRLAVALQVDEEYLTFKQTMPRRERTRSKIIMFGGYLKAGAWDNTSKETAWDGIIDPSFDVDIVYSIEDETLAAKGIHTGMFLFAKKGEKSALGDVVVLRRTIKGAMELSAQVRTETGYERCPMPGSKPAKGFRGLHFEEKEIAVVKLTQMRLR